MRCTSGTVERACAAPVGQVCELASWLIGRLKCDHCRAQGRLRWATWVRPNQWAGAQPGVRETVRVDTDALEGALGVGRFLYWSCRRPW